MERKEKEILKFYVISVIVSSIILILCTFASAGGYDYERIADAIYIIEGKENANQVFGINPKYVACDSYYECRQICIRTIMNKETMWLNSNSKEDFLTFLSKRYCPPNHKVWLKNLKFYLERG